jgi:benzoyl-CoA reductase/2-hydroxyglutaryl-CoA dehydratase subunit BcrC/BadD/HgdB
MSDVNNLIKAPHELLVNSEGDRDSVIYFTADIPIEIITAANFIPFRIPSDLVENEKQTGTTSMLQPYICSKSHQFFDFVTRYIQNIGGAIFSENHCDSLQNFLDVVKMKNSTSVDFPSFRYLLPTNRGGEAETQFYKNEMERLLLWFQEWTGREITVKDIAKAVDQHNKKRELLQSLSKHIGNGIKIAEYLKLQNATDLLPISKTIKLLNEINNYLSDNSPSNVNQKSDRPRILISGSMFDNYKLFQGIEILNESTVGVDLSFISRTSEFQISKNEEVKNMDELLESIARAYIVDKIPDSVHRFPGRRKEYLMEKIEQLHVDGIVFIYYSFCDPDAFEVRSLSRYLESKVGIATLTLVTDPQLTNIHQLTTRVEAFMEKLGEI